MNYSDFCLLNKDRLIVKFKTCINDKTLHKHYFIETNVFCDGINYYIADITTSIEYKPKLFRVMLSKFAAVKGSKPKLIGTNNSLGYTRLIYGYK